MPALLVTRTVDTGQGGENDPNRALAIDRRRPDARPSRRRACRASTSRCRPPALPWLGNVAPVRVRKLYFSEKLTNPEPTPTAPPTFIITVDGETPKPFDPASSEPNIVVRQGDVEDWIIENRSTELHAFHIHQLHFLLLDWSGVPVNEPFLRDTVNVPYYNGRALAISERAAAHGLSRSRYRRHLRLSLPPAGARGRRHDGHDSRAARDKQCRFPIASARSRHLQHRGEQLNRLSVQVSSLTSLRHWPELARARDSSRSVTLANRRLRAPPKPDQTAATPIKHVIVIIGENRSFDHVFATYVPKPRRPASTTCCRGHHRARREQARDSRTQLRVGASARRADKVRHDAFLLNPPKQEFPATTSCPRRWSAARRSPSFPTNARRHADHAVRRASRWPSNPNPACPRATYQSVDRRHRADQPHTRPAHHRRQRLPAGPFQLTNGSTFPYDAYAASPVHRFYQMWQQLNCSKERAPAGQSFRLQRQAVLLGRGHRRSGYQRRAAARTSAPSIRRAHDHRRRFDGARLLQRAAGRRALFQEPRGQVCDER
jgi:hypothetical protein